MSSPLRVFILGLDERARNLFRMFFRGPCQNQAAIVDQENEADAFLIDLDTQQGAKLLEQQREKHPERVIILLSVKDVSEAKDVVFVKKPAQAQNMIAAIEKARAISKPPAASKGKSSLFGWAARKLSTPEQPAVKKPPVEAEAAKQAVELPSTSRDPSPPKPAVPPRPREAHPVPNTNQPVARPQAAAPGTKVVARPDKEETAVHRVAMLLDEQGFKSYLGHRDDIDPSKPEQWEGAFYDPKQYLQGHVQSAIKVAIARNEAIRLETPWKTITILPQQGLIHILADEAQIRAACGIPFRNIVGVDIDAMSLQQVLNIKPVSPSELAEILESPDLTRLDSFLWKVALLTSKGRLPKGLELNQGFYLKRWPGMTRLMLPPHAMRIAALLTQKPYSLFDAARQMGIRQQYVFAFVSAAYALGLIGQQAIEAEQASEPVQPVAAIPPGRQSLFKKILSRLKLI